MMTPEAIFTIIFIFVLLLIPFGLGLNLCRAFRKRKEIETLFSEMKYISGRVIGYTKRKYDSENMGDYYPIIEYIPNRAETLWAEGESCNKDKHPINSNIKLMFHPRDKRYVMPILTRDFARGRASFEKNIELGLNLIMTAIIIGSVIYYKGFAPNILICFCLSYALGVLFGVLFNKTDADEKIRVRQSKIRDKRLLAAQKRGNIPCYLEE